MACLGHMEMEEIAGNTGSLSLELSSSHRSSCGSPPQMMTTALRLLPCLSTLGGWQLSGSEPTVSPTQGHISPGRPCNNRIAKVTRGWHCGLGVGVRWGGGPRGTWVLVHQAPSDPTVLPRRQIDLSSRGKTISILAGQRDGSVGNDACSQA